MREKYIVLAGWASSLTLRYNLLLDFSKAFDSIHHCFIFQLLAHIGCPKWLVDTVRNLLFGVTSQVSLHGASFISLLVERGVKQGCPLSPIIFNLCTDVMIYLLKAIKDSLTRAFADDTGVFFTRTETFLLI